jgi:uncharacterized membrane protein YciS (DUF1049 family)
MANEAWHLSKSVPIGFIGGIIIQTFAIGWFISDMGTRIEVNTKDIARQEVTLNTMREQSQSHAIALARIDENLKAIREALEKMAEK